MKKQNLIQRLVTQFLTDSATESAENSLQSKKRRLGRMATHAIDRQTNRVHHTQGVQGLFPIKVRFR